MRRLALLSLLVVGVGSAAALPGAEPYTSWQRVDATSNSAVAISGDGRTVVVGDPFAEPCKSAVCPGAARIYVRAGARWKRLQTLTASASTPGFGQAVAVSGDGSTVVVGAYSPAADDPDTAAYVFVRSGAGWKLQTTFRGAAHRRFGGSVAVSGDGNTVAVGDVPDLERTFADGLAHAYVRAGQSWIETDALRGHAGDFTFGDGVAVSSNGARVLVLSRGEGGFVYARSGIEWKLAASLVPATGRFFLTSAALSPDGRVAVLTDDDLHSTVDGPGRAYVYVGSAAGWTKAQTIVEPRAPRAWHEFGKAVALARDGRTLVVGAPLTDVGSRVGPFVRGVVHVYARRGGSRWRLAQTLRSRDSFDFGESAGVTSDASALVVGGSPGYVLSP